MRPANTSTESSARPGDPLVTIAIPTFNRASWLPRCVSSALAQTYGNIDVLVSDNASTDDTQKVLQQLHHPQLRHVRHQRNIGLYQNFNACLAEARGDYILFVCDDDIIKPWMIAHAINVVRDHREAAVVIGLSDVFFVAENRLSRATIHDDFVTGIYDGTEILIEYLRDRISAPMCSILFRTEVLRAKGGFPVDLAYAGDTIVWNSLLLAGKAGFVNESCAAVSTHAANETSRMSLDTRLRCLHTTTDMLTTMINDAVEDAGVRSRLVAEARRYLARYAVGIIASQRSQGASLSDVLPALGALRICLPHLAAKDLTQAARPLAVTVLPLWTTQLVRRLMRRSKRENADVDTNVPVGPRVEH